MSQTTLIEYHPGLWLTERRLDEFDVRGAVVVGSERALVWDTLSHPRDMEPVHALLSDRPFSIAYSHADWDHVWGTAGLPAASSIVAHDACAGRFSAEVPETLARMQVEKPGQWDDVLLIPPTLTFSTTLTFDLGDVTVELSYLPGHTLDCLVAFIPEWSILLAGDTVETPFPIVNGGAGLGDWMRQLQGWAVDERVATVIPCHGEIGGRDLVRRNIDYLAGLRDRETPAIPSNMTAFYRAGHERNVRKANELDYTIRAVGASDRTIIHRFVVAQWGSERQVCNGEIYRPEEFPGFVAERDGQIVGFVPYRIQADRCEILLLNSLEAGKQIGRRLIDAVVEVAVDTGCARVTVVTTNDNLPALRLYQRMGFAVATIRTGAVDRSRALKPEIPATGVDGISIRDEIELELVL